MFMPPRSECRLGLYAEAEGVLQDEVCRDVGCGFPFISLGLVVKPTDLVKCGSGYLIDCRVFVGDEAVYHKLAAVLGREALRCAFQSRFWLIRATTARSRDTSSVPIWR